jgi:hypothetical protein
MPKVCSCSLDADFALEHTAELPFGGLKPAAELGFGGTFQPGRNPGVGACNPGVAGGCQKFYSSVPIVPEPFMLLCIDLQ